MPRYSYNPRITKVLWTLCFLALAVLYAMTSGCAHLKTAEGRYADGLSTFNDYMDTYRYHYAMQTPEVQAEWDREITPIADKASKALGLWKGTLDDATKEDAYIALERQFWNLLIQYGMKKEVQ
ncbi:MAG: hypothetical protein ACYSW3_00145 [Planctomycetota bacterium]